jgi:acetyl-CoA carboxylase biotin carboxylase subunit
MKTIHKLLVANRGEIARRIFRTCRDLGIRTVAVASDADVDLPYVAEADEAVRIGPPAPSSSYLSADAVIDAAKRSGADAIHPGYGFLSENAAFAQRVMDEGLIWVGPPPGAITGMGDKAESRRTAHAHGVPVVPGYDGDDESDDTFVREAARIGYPVLVKASAGGGGRGMRRVDDPADLLDAVASARREATSSFANGRLLLERYVLRPRHIEVQVFADTFGNIIHLGERECSVQRRHQKVLEEAPSPAVDAALRAKLGEAAVRVARAVDYVGAGTVEFVMSQDGEFFFLEMNTRLQVEHPVTELVTGLDLVAMQIAVAEGRPLPIAQDEVRLRGHAIEARVNAEDPNRDWMPGHGPLVRFELPSGGGVRVDSGYESGDVVGIHYDAMLAKVIAYGPDRLIANRRLRMALDASWAPGVVTNLPLLRDIVRDESWIEGDLDTGFLPRRNLPRVPPANLERGALIASVWAAAQRADVSKDLATPAAWRVWGSDEVVDRWAQGEAEVEVGVRDCRGLWEVRVGAESARRVRITDRVGDVMRVEIDGLFSTVRVARAAGDGAVEDGDILYVHLGDGESMVRLVPRFPAPAGLESEPGSCVAPTPGVVRVVHVAEGDQVAKGQLLVTLEAMKMEHHLRAPVDGVVSAVRCVAGAAVDGGALLVKIEEG